MHNAPALIPVILCGGSGTRLWPLSRQLHPKPFIRMGNGQTLFANTVKRVSKLADISTPLVISNEDYRFYILDTLDNLNVAADIILEPSPRNTAPALALAAFAILEQSDALMLAVPADHFFADESVFCKTVDRAVQTALDGRIVAFGITPTRPETGYGYIEQGAPLGIDSFEVKSFVEKPALERAKEMLGAGCYFWNSGIYLMRASTFLEELKAHAPEIFFACERAWQGMTRDSRFLRPQSEAFLDSPDISIDYAVMEKTRHAAMLPLDCEWSDMGSWDSFFQAGERDARGNVSIGDVLLEETENSYVHAQRRLVAAVGIKDLAIIESGDAVLVLPRGRTQEVKKIVDQLKAEDREEFKLHPVVCRPWGSYERLASGARFQVKRIIVKPDCALSLQKHYHRSEHWIIVRGTAEITIGQETSICSENQSVYIPLGQLHKLRNPGKIPLELIEVQSGAYLGEDDIERMEDSYGRK